MKILPNTIINSHAVYNKKWMEEVLLLLKSKYNLVSIQKIEDFYYNGSKLKNSCHITFDDGDKSFYNIVFPLLKKHNIPVSIYVSPSAAKEDRNFWFQEIRDYDKSKLKDICSKLLEKSRQHIEKYPLSAILKSLKVQTIWNIIREYQKETGTQSKASINMNVEQLKELHNSGLVSIGAHTQNHPILANETDKAAEDEIKSSVNQLSEILDTTVEHFAYPNGVPDMDFGQREIKYLQEAGIKIAFSTENKTFKSSENTLSIPRNGISYGNKNFVLMKLIAGSKWVFLKKLIKGKQEGEFRKEVIKNIINLEVV